VSIPLAERRRVRCVAFEPEPRNFHWLERNIALHRVGSLFTNFNLALHSEETRLAFELSPSNSGDHRVRGAPGGRRGAPTHRGARGPSG
jgi:FkbM family methyltransferase